MPFKWFFCFGTLLTIVRDKGTFKNKIDDVDVGVYFEEYEPKHIQNWCDSAGFKITNRIIDDVSKKPLYLALAPREDVQTITGKFHLDVFAWYKYKTLRLHTYDVNMENPKKGVPSKYIFKGVPAEALEDRVSVDGIAGSCFSGWIPRRYGTLFDIWYPHWLQKRKEVSHTKWKVEVSSCKALIGEKAEINEQSAYYDRVFGGRV